MQDDLETKAIERTDATTTNGHAEVTELRSEPGLDEKALIRIKEGYRARQAEIHFRGVFDGLWILANINPKRKVWRKLFDEDTADETLCSLILAHNLVDEDGDPLDQKLTPEDLEELPQSFIVLAVKEIATLVNDASEVSKRRKR